MRDFFSLEGSFNKYGGLVADTLILSLMWMLFSIPVITAGAATSAMFYVSTRRIADREGYITADFWAAFKANFVRSTLLWLIIMVAMGVLSFNMWLIVTNSMNMEGLGVFGFIILPAQLIFMVEILFMSIYMFPVTARFEMGFKQTIKSSFFMANRHLLTSILCTALLIGLIVIGLMTGFLLVAVPGIYAMLSSYLIMKVLKKYRPEMDKDPRLEIAEIEAKKAENRRRKEFSGDDGEEEEAVDHSL